MYKFVLAFILLATGSILTFGQEHETVLHAPDSWQSEIIPFPMDFTPGIPFTGFEDLRFSPGWADSTSQQFWTYCFAWYIEKQEAMTEIKLTEYFSAYYDGLMNVVAQAADSAKSTTLNKAFCLFIKTNEGFSGKMRVHDSFFAKDTMTLNIKVSESFCSRTNKQIILCSISPKDFDHPVWKIFDDVTLKVQCD